jgi:hypothetical protein
MQVAAHLLYDPPTKTFNGHDEHWLKSHHASLEDVTEVEKHSLSALLPGNQAHAFNVDTSSSARHATKLPLIYVYDLPLEIMAHPLKEGQSPKLYSLQVSFFFKFMLKHMRPFEILYK